MRKVLAGVAFVALLVLANWLMAWWEARNEERRWREEEK